MNPCPPPEDLLEAERAGPAGEPSPWAAHLAECGDCRELIELARSLEAGRGAAEREPVALGAPRDPARCPSEAHLAALAEGGLGDAEAAELRAHLADCGRCLELLEAALNEVRPAESGGAPVLAGPGSAAAPPALRPVPGPGARRPPLQRLARWVPAAAVLLVLFVLWGKGPGPGGAALGALARVEPIPVHVQRAAEPKPGSYQALLEEACEAYRSEQWERAANLFEAARAAGPADGLASLYLGSARLLLGAPAEARGALEEALESADAGAAGAVAARVREEALWQLVQVHLLEGEPERAAARLEELVRLDGEWREAAAELRESLRAGAASR